MPSPIVIDPAILTDRRRQVLDLLVEGLSNKEIGARLYLTEDTVKTHVHKLLRIFNVSKRELLIITAYRSGLVPCGRCRDAHEVRRG